MNQNRSSSNKLIDISLVTWNSATDLPVFLDSLKKQTCQDFHLSVWDNNSSDLTVDLINKIYPDCTLIRNNNNLGYAGGHNQIIKNSKCPYILITNPDIELAPNFIEKTLKYLKAQPRFGSIGGKLLKSSNALKDEANSDIIDSTGLVVYKNRRFVNRGENQPDLGQYNQPEEIFGNSGALVLFNRSALEDVKLPRNQYFDEDYFMYREDIDLAWRLRQQNWPSFFLPQIVAWHRRTASQTNLPVIQQRQLKKSYINKYSYRNHWFTLIKNESLRNLFWWWPWISWYEFKKFIYLLFFEARTLLFCLASIRLWPRIFKKRIYILKHKACSESELRKWFK